MALRFLQQASDNGYPAASVLIGKVMAPWAFDLLSYTYTMQIFTEGSDEVPRDYLKAMQHYEMAADQVRGLPPHSVLALFRCTFYICVIPESWRWL